MQRGNNGPTIDGSTIPTRGSNSQGVSANSLHIGVRRHYKEAGQPVLCSAPGAWQVSVQFTGASDLLAAWLHSGCGCELVIFRVIEPDCCVPWQLAPVVFSKHVQAIAKASAMPQASNQCFLNKALIYHQRCHPRQQQHNTEAGSRHQ